MFRFCLLSILCICVTASAALAHSPSAGDFLFTENGIDVIVGKNAVLTGNTEPYAEGWHEHTYTYTISGKVAKYTKVTQVATL